MMPGNESVGCCRSGSRSGSGCIWWGIACTASSITAGTTTGSCSARGGRDRLNGAWLDSDGRNTLRLYCTDRLYTARIIAIGLDTWWSCWLDTSCSCRSWSSWGCRSRCRCGTWIVVPAQNRLNSRGWWISGGWWCWINRFDWFDWRWRNSSRFHSYRLHYVCSWCYSASLICRRTSFNRLGSCCRSDNGRWG